MTQLLSRPVIDDFTYPWFVELIEKIDRDLESYYMWSLNSTKMLEFFDTVDCRAPLVIIGIKDHLDALCYFDWWQNHQQAGCAAIEKFAKKHPDTKIILFTSLENLEIELQQPNLHIIPWGGDWVNQQTEYQTLEPVLNKNFNSDRSFICLNRYVKAHRLITLSYLFGNNYQDHGVISYLDNPNGNPDILLDIVNWQFGTEHDDIRSRILQGFELIKSSNDLVNDTFDIYHVYGNRDTDNIGNFENRLRKLYQNSFVEIVGETTFAEPSFLVTEKTAHTFYGCNFPIILSGVGIIAHLRELGFDMFDDVVDHSYDTIANPFDRIVSAIESNRRLLVDADYAKQSWIRCRPRFEHNVSVVRNIYSWYEQRAKAKFAQILGNLSR